MVDIGIPALFEIPGKYGMREFSGCFSHASYITDIMKKGDSVRLEQVDAIEDPLLNRP